MRITTLLLLFVSLLRLVPSAGADGMLDPSFGNGGLVVTNFPGVFSPDVVLSLVVLPDGRAVAAGQTSFDLDEYEMAVARYLPSGALDTSFGGGDGLVAVSFLPWFGGVTSAETVLLQPDGRLVLVGGCPGPGGAQFALARLHGDGALDPSFGSGGRVFTPFPIRAQAVAGLLQADGRIVAVGWAGDPQSPRIAAARYNGNGSLDPTFGTGGLLILNLAQSFSTRDAALQPDGKIVIAGTYGGLDFGLVRLLPSGTADPSFDGDGLVTSDFGAVENGYLVIVLGDGRLVLTGTRLTDLALARYLPDGALDTTFGTGGLAAADSGGTEVPGQLIQLPNGKLLVAGYTSDTGLQDFLLARLHPDGTVDTSFGTSGFLRTDFNNTEDQALAVALAGADLVLAAGITMPAFDFALARYIATVPVELRTFTVE